MGEKMRKRLLLITLSLLFVLVSQFTISFPAHATQPFKPGKYEELMLAVDQEGNLEGYYNESQGEGIVKTCTFFFKGKAADSRADITAWNDQSVPGVLKAEAKGVNLRIEHGRDFPGCSMVLMPEIAQGISLDKTMEAAWNTLDVVDSERAYLYSAPVDDKKLKTYLIKNDVAGVLAKQGDWVKIEFPREGKKSVTGWVKAVDVKELAALK